MTLRVKDADGATQTIKINDDIAGTAGTPNSNVLTVQGASGGTAVPVSATQLGEVQASPTAYTLLARLKDLLTGIVLAAGTNIIGKVGIDQTTPGTTNAVAPIAGQNGVAGGAGAVSATVQRVTLASDDPAVAALVTNGVLLKAGEAYVGSVGGKSFDVTVTPTVTNGAYSAGDIVGGLIEVAAGRVANGKVTLQSIEIHLKAAVTSTLTVVLLSASPTDGPTTTTDNAAYSLNAADVFKVRSVVSGFTLTDHGTPNTYGIHSLNRILTTDASNKFYALILDGTGFTLTSTGDLQIRFTGYQD